MLLLDRSGFTVITSSHIWDIKFRTRFTIIHDPMTDAVTDIIVLFVVAEGYLLYYLMISRFGDSDPSSSP